MPENSAMKDHVSKLVELVDYTWRGIPRRKLQNRKYMKSIILLISVVTLLTSAGCIVPVRGGGEYRGRGEYRDHRDYRRHSAAIVGPPVSVVRTPELIVR